VNDFADDEKAAVLKNFAGGIGEIDGALDAVTNPNCLPVAPYITDGNNTTVAPNPSTTSLR